MLKLRQEADRVPIRLEDPFFFVLDGRSPIRDFPRNRSLPLVAAERVDGGHGHHGLEPERP